MVMPLPVGLRPASPVSRGATGHYDPHPRSPVKKLAGHDAASVNTTHHGGLNSPQKLKAAVALSVHSSSSSLQPAVSSQSIDSVTPWPRAPLRAQVLQTILSLLDRGDSELQQVLPLLELVASLPPNADNLRQRCLTTLQQVLGDNHKASHAQSVEHAQSPRNSGRAKSPVTLRSCKEFLLACTNEIHELEEVNPYFDYEEDTASEAQTPAAFVSRKSPWLFASFDYASTADSSLPMQDDEDDDNCADQGSQLSEVLCRVAEADADDQCFSAWSPTHLPLADRLVCRRAFDLWRGRVRGSSSSLSLTMTGVHATAAMYQAFSALTRHRADSRLSVARKQRAFHRLKLLVQQRHQPTVIEVSTPLPTRSRLRQLVLIHWDAVVLVLIAVMMQALGQ